MTSILYVKDDGLYADRRFVKPLPHKFAVSFTDKIHISEDKTFMYALSGEWVFGKFVELENNMKDFLERAKNYSKINDTPSYKLGNQDNPKPVFNGDLVIVTKEGEAWLCTNDDKMYYSVNLTDLPYFGVGSGSAKLEAVMRLKGDPMEAMKIATRFDNLSGGDIQSVKISDINKEEVC